MKNKIIMAFGILIQTPSISIAQPMMSSFFALNSECEVLADLGRIRLALRSSILQADQVHGRASKEELQAEENKIIAFQAAYSQCLEQESAHERASIEPGANIAAAKTSLQNALQKLSASVAADEAYPSAYADDAEISRIVLDAYAQSHKLMTSLSGYGASVESLRNQLRDKSAALIQRGTACRILARGSLNNTLCKNVLRNAAADSVRSFANNRTLEGASGLVRCEVRLPNTCREGSPQNIVVREQSLPACLASAILKQREHACVTSVNVFAFDSNNTLAARRSSDELSVAEIREALLKKEKSYESARKYSGEIIAAINDTRAQLERMNGEMQFLHNQGIPSMRNELQWRMSRAQALPGWIHHLRGPGSKWFYDMWVYCNNVAWYYWNRGQWWNAYPWWGEAQKYANGFWHTQHVLIPQAENELRDHQAKIPQVQQHLFQMENRMRELQLHAQRLAQSMQLMEQHAQKATMNLLNARASIIGLQPYEQKAGAPNAN